MASFLFSACQLVLAVSVLLASSWLTAAQPVVTLVQPFSAVSICVPYNVLIAPSNDSRTYSIAIEADAAVARNTRASGSNGTLSLESVGNFQTSKPVKLTIFLPGSKYAQLSFPSNLALSVARLHHLQRRLQTAHACCILFFFGQSPMGACT